VPFLPPPELERSLIRSGWVRSVAKCLINAKPCGPSTSAREGAGLWLEGPRFGRGVRKPDPLPWVRQATRMCGSAKNMQVLQNPYSRKNCPGSFLLNNAAKNTSDGTTEVCATCHLAVLIRRRTRQRRTQGLYFKPRSWF
jgi:hypothetical protein